MIKGNQNHPITLQLRPLADDVPVKSHIHKGVIKPAYLLRVADIRHGLGLKEGVGMV